MSMRKTKQEQLTTRRREVERWGREKENWRSGRSDWLRRREGRSDSEGSKGVTGCSYHFLLVFHVHHAKQFYPICSSSFHFPWIGVLNLSAYSSHDFVSPFSSSPFFFLFFFSFLCSLFFFLLAMGTLGGSQNRHILQFLEVAKRR